ncbi:MAG TPA: XRE family transcriptional regulator [Blastocatellia bacterium]
MERISFIMEPRDSHFEQRIASRIKELRVRRQLTLDDLAKRSGVSRSMISLIERAESSPTAAVLDKLAASLGVTLASLFADDEQSEGEPISRRQDQLTWSDPESGYIRRNISPSGFPSAIELVEVILPARTRVAYDSGPRAVAVDQQVWVLEGEIEVTVGKNVYRLTAGDCLAMKLDLPIVFRNRGRQPTRHLVALTASTATAGMFSRRK